MLEETSLADLHHIIQNCFEWHDAHLHAFILGSHQYAPKDFELEMTTDYTGVTLKGLNLQPNAKFSYDYDFGDNWQHTVLEEAIVPIGAGATYPRCIAGKRAAPVEDCGGIYGFEEFCAILQNPKHPEYEEWAEWYGLDVGAVFDPAHLDLGKINEALECMKAQ